jgi:ribonuclease HI
MILDVYVDGSFYARTPDVTYGGIVIVKDIGGKDESVLLVRRVDTKRKEFVSANNAGGELIAALTGFIDACSICSGEKSIVNLHYDYKGIREFITGNYVARKQGPILYVGSMDSVKKSNPNVELKFHKIEAHTGNWYNDKADEIAKGFVLPRYESVRKETITI